nr:putative uncharacterized protein encoded by LINC00269 isoform X1 [Macaca fascicularis]
MTSGPQINQPKEYLTSFKSGVEQDSRIEAYTVHPHCWNTKCNNYLHTAKHCHKTPKSETWSFYVAQPGLELLGSNDLPASASQISGITGVIYHTKPSCTIKNN